MESILFSQDELKLLLQMKSENFLLIKFHIYPYSSLVAHEILYNLFLCINTYLSSIRDSSFSVFT